ncbi:MAG: glutathione S-transferase family protein [Gammaproteobacteria bacterium]|nr:glutathione S-transferase family protein [Gammaproteobacteria bacterium]
MASDLVFYTHPMSRGRIARWMLEEVGEPYDTELLEMGGSIKGADYLAINPMGKVPAIRHGDRVVTETAAICAYLADAFPDAGLAPPTNDRADYYRWLFFAAGPLEAAVSNSALGLTVPTERESTVGYGNLATVIDTLEKAIAGREFVAGTSFSAADVYVGSHIGWGFQMGTIEERPALAEYCNHVQSRPAHLRAQQIDDALVQQG